MECFVTDTTLSLDDLVGGLARRAAQPDRTIVALAGPPGSGKSTVAERLADRINALHPGAAAVLPMDGFHYDDLYLVPAGLRPRKGAPETFDVGGLAQTLRRIRARDEDFVAVPVFDRTLEVARAGARLIPSEVPVVIVEGNYLLLDRAPWTELRALFDLSILLDVPEDVLTARLEARWRDQGLSADETSRKLLDNDLPNARLVLRESRGADFVLANA